MNWYKNIKISQQIVENPPGLPYTLIGHDQLKGLTVDHEEFLWVWKDGGLDVRKQIGKMIGNEKAIHNRVWKFVVDSYYRGRAEKHKDLNSIISVIIPWEKRFREVPNSLISQLYDRFGSNSEIYIYK
jgi:hypothetical protein